MSALAGKGRALAAPTLKLRHAHLEFQPVDHWGVVFHDTLPAQVLTPQNPSPASLGIGQNPFIHRLKMDNEPQTGSLTAHFLFSSSRHLYAPPRWPIAACLYSAHTHLGFHEGLLPQEILGWRAEPRTNAAGMDGQQGGALTLLSCSLELSPKPQREQLNWHYGWQNFTPKPWS